MSAEESNEINTPTYDLTAVPVIDIGSLVYKKVYYIIYVLRLSYA